MTVRKVQRRPRRHPIRNWTKKLTIFTNGAAGFNNDQLTAIEKHNLQLVDSPIIRVEHREGQLESVVCENGQGFNLRALYARQKFKQHSDIPEQLGCEFTETGLITVDPFQRTTVSGVYAAGDNSIWGRAVSMSVSAGAVAGMALNKELVVEEF